MNIGFIGYGNMARAIALGLQKNKDYSIFASAPSLPKGTDLTGIQTNPNNDEFIEKLDVIILAVKPHQIKNALHSIKSLLNPKQIIVSVAAGVTTAFIKQHCPENQPVIRAMPNTPISLGVGATPFYADKDVFEPQKQIINDIFKHTGIVCWVEKENDINAFTALSGSGPAYVYLFIESMIKGACKFGISQELAREFAIQTVLGATNMAKHYSGEIAELRKQVTSPNGTTAAAITTLQENQFEAIVEKAMAAAKQRAESLALE